MICLEIALNDNERILAGVSSGTVTLTAGCRLVEENSPPELSYSVFGLDLDHGAFVRWRSATLAVGDRLSIRVRNNAIADSPIETHPLPTGVSSARRPSRAIVEHKLRRAREEIAWLRRFVGK